jgi:hypothetical protein
MTKIVTQSSLGTWRRCKHLYNYKYIEKLRPRSLSRPLAFGSAVHKIIEFRIKGIPQDKAIEEMNKGRAQLFSAEIDAWDQIMMDASDIMIAYDLHYKKDPLKYPVTKGLKAEHHFTYELGGGFQLKGVIDAMPESDDGRRWVMEHKTRGGRIENDSVRTRDVQTMIYAEVAQGVFGIKRIAGVMWDYVRSKSPPVPDILKDGSISKRKIDTLPHVYERFILAHGLDIRHYQEVLGTLDEGVSAWFRRVRLPLNRSAMGVIFDETRTTAREIHRKAGVDTTRSLTRDCSWCSYEKLCMAELMGMDADFIREREYRVDDKAHSELPEEPDGD